MVSVRILVLNGILLVLKCFMFTYLFILSGPGNGQEPPEPSPGSDSPVLESVMLSGLAVWRPPDLQGRAGDLWCQGLNLGLQGILPRPRSSHSSLQIALISF